jgi:hypothetical protein
MKRNHVVMVFILLVLVFVGFLHMCSTESFNAGEVDSPALPCNPGYWCPTASGGAKAYPCPGGTYGSEPKLTEPKCSGICSPGCVCNEASTSACQDDCPAGYYCVAGTGGVSPPIICPPGYYCPSKTEIPIVCPPGVFCAAGTSSI